MWNSGTVLSRETPQDLIRSYTRDLTIIKTVTSKDPRILYSRDMDKVIGLQVKGGLDLFNLYFCKLTLESCDLIGKAGGRFTAGQLNLQYLHLSPIRNMLPEGSKLTSTTILTEETSTESTKPTLTSPMTKKPVDVFGNSKRANVFFGAEKPTTKVLGTNPKKSPAPLPRFPARLPLATIFSSKYWFGNSLSAH